MLPDALGRNGRRLLGGEVFHFFFWHGLSPFDAYGRNNTPALSRRAQMCRLWKEATNPPMLNQGLDMLIDCIGDYGTNGYESAHVFGLRGVNCIGYIVQPDGGKLAAVWHSKDGTRINGPADENLVRFVRPAKPKTKAR
jgi:hypothetical protein